MGMSYADGARSQCHSSGQSDGSERSGVESVSTDGFNASEPVLSQSKGWLALGFVRWGKGGSAQMADPSHH